MGWRDADNDITSIEYSLSPYWTMRFYDHKEHYDRGAYLDVTGQGYVRDLDERWSGMDNELSSFELILLVISNRILYIYNSGFLLT